MVGRIIKWCPLAGAGAWLVREATHLHHWAAPATLLYCVVPAAALGAWAYWRRRS